MKKGGVDLTYDPGSKRIYAACDGDADVYEQSDPDNYKLLAKVPTGPVGRTALLVPDLKRYFVAVPQHGTRGAQVLVFDVPSGTPLREPTPPAFIPRY